MSLAAGTILGPYKILSPLGAGGMDEVYRAKDTRLDRDVAIKLLPADVAVSNAGWLASCGCLLRDARGIRHPCVAIFVA